MEYKNNEPYSQKYYKARIKRDCYVTANTKEELKGKLLDQCFKLEVDVRTVDIFYIINQEFPINFNDL